MAERVLQRVEDELTCHVCLDTYKEPKLLQCFHIYCKLCLRKLVVEKDDGQLVLPCPECRQETPIPPKGVAGLTPAFHINRLLGIVGEPRQENREEAREEERKEEVKWLCPEHSEEELKLYCETCGVLICWKCAYAGAAHHSHVHDLVDDAFKKYQVEIPSLQELVEKQMVKVTTALERIETFCAEIDTLYEAVSNNFRYDARKMQIMSQMEHITGQKTAELAAQQQKLEKTKTQLKSCLDFMKNSVASTDSQFEVLKIKTSLTKQIKELTIPLQLDSPHGSCGFFEARSFLKQFNGKYVRHT